MTNAEYSTKVIACRQYGMKIDQAKARYSLETKAVRHASTVGNKDFLSFTRTTEFIDRPLRAREIFRNNRV